MKRKEQKSPSRRKFIKNTLLASAGWMIVPRHVIGGNGHIPPSDTLYLAGIGAGGKGQSDISECAKSPYVKVVSLCDVDTRQAKKARETYDKASFYADFREMLDKEADNIDAVTISTPDHTHAVAAMACMTRGKHVYVQKPLTWSIYEARVLTETARKYKVVTQMGNQGASGEGVRRMQEMYNSGIIGKVQKVIAWTNRPVWPQGIPLPKDKASIPSELNWDLWQGPAQEADFHEGYVPFGWRGWTSYGTGSLGDMACHILDPAFRILPIDYPSAVEGSFTTRWVGTFREEMVPEAFPPSSVVYFSFPVKGEDRQIDITWMDGGLRPQRPFELAPDEPMGNWDGGIIFEGTNGKILADCYGANPRILSSSKVNSNDIPKTLPRVEDGHYLQWVNACIKGYGNAPLSSSFDYAGPFTEAILLGVLAMRAYYLKDGKDYPGRTKLLWDPRNMKVTNVKIANDLVHREYRKGWKLEN